MAINNYFSGITGLSTKPVVNLPTATETKQVFTNIADFFTDYGKKVQEEHLANLEIERAAQVQAGTLDPSKFTEGIRLISDPEKRKEFIKSVGLAEQEQALNKFNVALYRGNQTGDFRDAEALLPSFTNPVDQQKALEKFNTTSNTGFLNRYLLNAYEAANTGNIEQLLPTLQNMGSHLSTLPPELQEQAFTKIQALRPVVEQRFGENAAKQLFGQYFTEEQNAANVLRSTAVDVYKKMGQSPLMQFTGTDLVPAPITEEVRAAYAKTKGYDLTKKTPTDIDKEITSEQDEFRKSFARGMIDKSGAINPPDVNQALRTLNNKLLEYGIQPTEARTAFEALRDARKLLSPEDKASIEQGTKQLERARELSLDKLNREYSFLTGFTKEDVSRIVKTGVTDEDLSKAIDVFDPSWQLASRTQDDQAEIRDRVYTIRSNWADNGLARMPSNAELISALYRIKDSAVGSDGITANMDRILPSLKEVMQENASNPPKSREAITKDFDVILNKYFTGVTQADTVRDAGLANLMATASARSGNTDVAQTLAGFQRILGNYGETPTESINSENTISSIPQNNSNSNSTRTPPNRGGTKVITGETRVYDPDPIKKLKANLQRAKDTLEKDPHNLIAKTKVIRYEKLLKDAEGSDTNSTVVYEGKKYSIDNIMDAIAFAETGTVSESDLATVRGGGKTTGGVGKYQVIRSTAIQPGFGVKNIFQLADERGIKYSGKKLEDARVLLEIPELNKEFAYGYIQGLIKEFGPEKALRFYRSLEEAKRDPAYFNRFNSSLKGNYTATKPKQKETWDAYKLRSLMGAPPPKDVEPYR